MTTKWHYRHLAAAELVASWSKDPSTKVGARIVDAQRISKGQSACRLPLLTDGLAVRPMNARQLTRDIDTWKLANKPALCQSALWRF